MWRGTGGFFRDRSFEIRCGVVAVVTSRSLGDMARGAPLRSALKRLVLRPNSWVAGEQVHGERVVRVLRPSAPRRLPSLDGLTTNKSGLALSIRVADCAPVFIVDPVRRAIAAVHAGWRGVHQEILSEAVRRMGLWFGSRPRDLWVSVGPRIQPCCYEVGPEVAGFFLKRSAVRRRGKKMFLDLAAALKGEAIRAGISAGHFSAAPQCTAHDRRFHSFRRDKTKERQVAILALI